MTQKIQRTTLFKAQITPTFEKKNITKRKNVVLEQPYSFYKKLPELWAPCAYGNMHLRNL